MSADKKTPAEVNADAISPEPTEAEVASTFAEIISQSESENVRPVVPPARQMPPIPLQVPKLRKQPGAGILVFGVLLPVITLAVELTTRMCAEEFFDPMPTWWHTALVALVPAGNLILLLKLRENLFAREEDRQRLHWLGWLNGAVLGIAFFYTLVYLPLMPLAVIALLFMGLGILPLTPFIALIASLVNWAHWRNAVAEIKGSEKRRNRPVWLGIGGVFLLLLVMEFPRTVTTLGMKMANSSDAGTSRRGLQLLRTVGSRKAMVQACYGDRRESVADLGSWLINQGDPVNSDDARRIYYQVTGKSFSSIARPTQRSRRDVFSDTDVEWDMDQGGSTIAGRLKGLSLHSSRLDQSIDANAATSYTEWTLTFKNVAQVQREARAQIALPPGGVVSRLTLWVNGEEREAAFAGRGKVTQAYQQIVQQRRDPVLVTTQGPDRVMMQCFPVPANGGEMKVRLGITAPLILQSREQALAHLPHFIEMNFGIASELNHYVWSESAQPLAISNSEQQQLLKAEQPDTDRYALRGGVSEQMLANGSVVIALRRNPEIVEMSAADITDKNKKIIRQKIEEAPVLKTSRIVFVIDGSQSMQAHRAALQQAIRSLPASAEQRVLIAGDEVIELNGSGSRLPNAAPDVSGQLQTVSFVGGTDNVAALAKAWDLAAEKSDGVMVWIHGAQPVLLRDVEELRQRWERQPNGPALYDFQVDTGVNRVVERLDDIPALHVVTRQSDVEKDLRSLLTVLTGNSRPLILRREKINDAATASPADKSLSHIARLWARDEVLRMIAASSTNSEDAQKLAATYQLVTPVSGAVVLETEAQYRQAGLTPVDPNTVPTIPEPEVWLLIAIVGAVVLWAIYRRRRECL